MWGLTHKKGPKYYSLRTFWGLKHKERAQILLVKAVKDYLGLTFQERAQVLLAEDYLGFETLHERYGAGSMDAVLNVSGLVA